VAGNVAGFFALKTDGTMWGWGQNSGGPLGQNSQTDYSSPIQIGSDTDWINIIGGTNNNRGIVGIKEA
jgi:alpha-tubulin suppressor-like RCC1 family protein